jgi:UDP-N-acetylglucosamine 2-epimerase (non-hydrolysing)
MKIMSVVGARPNFMKIAPFIAAIEATDGLEHILVHTGQHYDDKMSQQFLDSLNIPPPDINLGIGSGSHAEQVGRTMIEFEKVLLNRRPDWVVVVGDVNATLACSVTAKKLHIKVCHIEAGLRSGDIRMPEEINRLVTDRLSDLLLTPDQLSSQNLLKEGVPSNTIKFVGNIMIDTLEKNRLQAKALELDDIINKNSAPCQLGDERKIYGNDFALITLHRPSNVDQKRILSKIVSFLLNEVTQDMPIVWPLHPRTLSRLIEFGLKDDLDNHESIYLLEPLGYHEMMRLNMGARLLLTDSGGLQEECTILGTPCLTLRWNTERPITLRDNGGASVLVGNNIDRIREEYQNTLLMKRAPERPKLWDGNAAGRCVSAIMEASGLI